MASHVHQTCKINATTNKMNSQCMQLCHANKGVVGNGRDGIVVQCSVVEYHVRVDRWINCIPRLHSQSFQLGQADEGVTGNAGDGVVVEIPAYHPSHVRGTNGQIIEKLPTLIDALTDNPAVTCQQMHRQQCW